jgi:hypothetical protein
VRDGHIKHCGAICGDRAAVTRKEDADRRGGCLGRCHGEHGRQSEPSHDAATSVLVETWSSAQSNATKAPTVNCVRWTPPPPPSLVVITPFAGAATRS